MRLPAAEGEHLASVTRISLRYQGEAAQTVERPEYAGLAADPLFAQGRFPVLNFDAHFIALLLRDQSLCVQSVVIVGQPELVKNRLLFSLSHPGFHFPVVCHRFPPDFRTRIAFFAWIYTLRIIIPGLHQFRNPLCLWEPFPLMRMAKRKALTLSDAISKCIRTGLGFSFSSLNWLRKAFIRISLSTHSRMCS